MSCPPLPQCASLAFRCEPPLIFTTPLDINGCMTGCPACLPADIPQPHSCGIPVELCQEDYPSCIQVSHCDNRDEVLFALPCTQDECVFTENMERVQPCERNCVNITYTDISAPPSDKFCDKLVGAITVLDQESGELVLFSTQEPCHLDQEGYMQYGMYSPTTYTTVDKLDGIKTDLLSCVDEFYVSGDLVCYCDCDDNSGSAHNDPERRSPPPPRKVSPPPPRKVSPPPSPPPTRKASPPPSPPPRKVGPWPIQDCGDFTGHPCPDKNPAPIIVMEDSTPDREFKMANTGDDKGVGTLNDGSDTIYTPRDDADTSSNMTGSMNSKTMSPGLVIGIGFAGAGLLGALAGIVRMTNKNTPNPNQLLSPSGKSEVTFCDNPLSN